MDKTKIVFFGTPQFVIPVLDKLQQNFQLVGVVTAPDQKKGRKQLLTPSPVKLASQGDVLEAPVLTPEKLDLEAANQLSKLQPDLFVVAAYGKIIPQNILNIPQFGALNIHPSLLPKYRGPSPLQNTLLNGEELSGVSIIKMDAQIDHGPLIYTKEYTLSHNDNYLTLGTKLFQAGVEALAEIIPGFIAGEIPLKEQDHSQATFTKIISKEDGFFEIITPPSLDKLDRMIRAYYPWPTVWTRWNNKIVKFLPEGLVQMEGKKPIKLAEFLRSHPDFPFKNL